MKAVWSFSGNMQVEVDLRRSPDSDHIAGHKSTPCGYPLEPLSTAVT